MDLGSHHLLFVPQCWRVVLFLYPCARCRSTLERTAQVICNLLKRLCKMKISFLKYTLVRWVDDLFSLHLVPTFPYESWDSPAYFDVDIELIIFNSLFEKYLLS